KKAQVETIRAETATMQGKLKELAEFQRNIDQKRSGLRLLAQQLQEMKGTLAEEIDIPLFINMVVGEAAKVGVTVLGIKPTEASASEFVGQQAFELSFRCVYVQLLLLLERLSTVERIIRVDNFDVKPTGPSSGAYVEIGGTIEIK